MSNLFFFQPEATPERARVHMRAPIPTPETGWRPPRDFPNLSEAYVIGRDRETKELDFDNGPGWSRGKGHIVGEVVTAWDKHFQATSWYFPMRHEVEPEYNMNPEQVTRFVRDIDAMPQTKVYANSIYDIGWGTEDGGDLPNGEMHDVQIAEALLSENDPTALDALIKKYVDAGGKDTNALYAWCAECYGGDPTGKQRENIYRASPRLVGPYAEADTRYLLPVLMKQVHDLREQELYPVYRMICEFIPLLVKMRRRGVRVDLDKANELYHKLGPSVCSDRLPGEGEELGLIAGLEKQLYDMTGIWCNVDAGADLEKVFNAVNIPFPRTPKTEPTAKNPNGGGDNPSFTAEFLNSVEHPVGELVVSIRQHKKLKSTFIKSYILDSHYQGRVHGQYHPTKSDQGGTRVGRLASSTPNLQNIPSRTALGREIRKMFLPDIGSLCLEKGDHSQLQYRILAHFAVDHIGGDIYADGPHSNALRDEYNANPHTDYHSRTQRMVQQVSGLYIPRSSEEASQGRMTHIAQNGEWITIECEPGSDEWKQLSKAVKEGIAVVYYTPWNTGRFTIKETNFGLMFGMGKKKLIRQSGLPVQKGEDVFNSYHQGNPYVKATMDYMSYLGQRDGYVCTALGRRTRFDLYVKKGYSEEKLKPVQLGQALREWGPGNVQRANTYKALCNVLQGTEGEIIIAGMLRNYKEGIYDIIGYPLLTTHDEVVDNVVDDSEATRRAFARMRWNMANATLLRVPLVYESTRGLSWGDAKTPIEEWTP